jgi:dTDP-4-amino-4,6-dideoxygalactose transaminase
MEFIDLHAQQQRIHETIENRIRTVLDHGQYIMGPEIKQLEEKLAHYCGVRHAVSCASGTDALLLALMAYGIGPGDAVFTSPFTFIATAEVIQLLGATPVFVDIDPETFNMDPNLLAAAIEAVEDGRSKNHPLPKSSKGPLTPKAVIAVDLFGLPADYPRINRNADKCGAIVIEDAAQSFGAELNGKKACSLASVGCTSFFPAKPLGCYGDGGMCFTDDDERANLMRSFSRHGEGSDRYENVRIGINGRLDTLQAAVLLAKFEIFPEELELRRKVARSYTELLSCSTFATPRVADGYGSSWAQYSLMAGNARHRSSARNQLKEKGIPTAVYYPKPLHLQTAFGSLKYKRGDFPVSEQCSERIFSLPMYPYLKDDELRLIAQHLIDIPG